MKPYILCGHGSNQPSYDNYYESSLSYDLGELIRKSVDSNISDYRNKKIDTINEIKELKPNIILSIGFSYKAKFENGCSIHTNLENQKEIQNLLRNISAVSNLKPKGIYGNTQKIIRDFNLLKFNNIVHISVCHMNIQDMNKYYNNKEGIIKIISNFICKYQ